MADWWPKACAAQSWKSSDRALRMRVLSEAVKREITSANDLNSREDIDAVKAHLGMLADQVAETMETDHPEIGQARRVLANIQDFYLPCLAVYLEPPTLDHARNYALAIVKDKVKRGPGVLPLALANLSPQNLEHLQMTLARTIQTKRKKSGDSLHTMKIKAKVKCTCAQCEPRKRMMIVMEPQRDLENEPF